MFVFHYGIESLLLGKIVCACLLVPFLWAKSMQRSFNIELKTDMVFFHRLAIYSFPLVAGNLSAWLLNLSDRYILQIYRSVQEVGIYSASYSIADKSVMLFVNLFMFASGPIIMRLWEREGEARTKEFNSSMARYFLMICMPMVVGLCVLAKPIIRLLTGPQYFDGYTIVPFIAIGVFFFGLQQMFQTGFLLHKKTVFITIGICIAGVFNIILNFIFVPSFGYVAAASAALASYVLLSLIMIVGSRRLYKWDFPCRSLCRISTAVVVMGIVVHYLYIAGVFSRSSVIELLLLVFFGFIVNLLMLFVLREFSNEELSYAKQFFLRAVGR
jgi:O-antigen/teichoic acid export membrane protein